MLSTHPSVFAVNDEYQICTLVNSECIMWVEVSGKRYFDHSNGVMRSASFLHIVKVPMAAIDCAEEYTVFLRRINDRSPNLTKSGEVESFHYNFKRLNDKESYNIINLADSHGLVDAPITSGGYFGDALDLLILNGDIHGHSDDIQKFKAIYLIAGAITKGRVPCVFARGNHDLRGKCAEFLEHYTPTDHGRTYFTFRVGPVWGIVLDMGENKGDTNPDYGGTICCNDLREAEEEFLERVISEREYAEAPIRIVISHNPFVHRMHAPHDVAQDTCFRWCQQLKLIKPHLWLSGHFHVTFLEAPGDEHDTYGAPCPVLTSSWVNVDNKQHISGAVTLSDDCVIVRYHNESGKIVKEEEMKL